MKLLSFLATLFYGGTVWVAADYYMEFRTSSARGQSVTIVTHLYHCKPAAAGTRAYAAAVSHCNPLPDDQKANIYYNHNFYYVYKPNLLNHVMQLMDRYRSATRHEWSLGYTRHAIDHPNFGPPSQEEVTYFRAALMSFGVDEVVPQYLLPGLSNYFAQSNLMTFYENPMVANSFFSGFTTFLRRIMQQYNEVDEELSQQQRRELYRKLQRAMKLCLRKMIDPCSVLHGNLKNFASHYCATYCTFLGFASRHFATAESVCSLKKGQCVGLLCACNRVMVTAFAGCPTNTIPMPMCHNYLREDVQKLTI